MVIRKQNQKAKVGSGLEIEQGERNSYAGKNKIDNKVLIRYSYKENVIL